VHPLKHTDDARLHSTAALHPSAKPHFEHLLDEVKRRGWWPYVSSAVRTFEEQGGLAGSKATKGCSWHQFGRAIDLDINGDVSWNPDTYGALGAWWEAQGPQFVWGGRWASKYPPHGDFTHFQYAPTEKPGPLICGARDRAAFDRYWRGVEPGGGAAAAAVAVGGFFLWVGLKLLISSRARRR
jgi:hypothetical protein